MHLKLTPVRLDKRTERVSVPILRPGQEVGSHAAIVPQNPAIPSAPSAGPPVSARVKDTHAGASWQPAERTEPMPQYIFSYRSAKAYDAAADPDGLAAWSTFINDVIAPSLTDPGWPVFEPAAVLGEAGPSTKLGGYAVIIADDLQAAVSLAERCPIITRGGGVEVAVLAALPPEHPAEQIRARLAQPR